ncbi:MAG: efflux RND transporter periplasmic adaptor subunit, partial [Candidatus Riflebacteria bacterium]|nr:efflux RND transporter periplasmic adaptor subunit [Candidatus Riflebacteria bacterium]
PQVQDYYLTVSDVLDDGTRVKKGDVVMRFDDSSYLRALDGARSDMGIAKSDVEKTRFELDTERIELELNIKRKQLELDKAKVMVVENTVIVSQVELKKAKLAVDFAQLELDQAKKVRKEFDRKQEVSMKSKQLKVDEAQRKIDEQEDTLKKIEVRAPRDGIIFKPFVRLNNEKGRVEKNKVVSPGDRLLEIPEFDRFQAIVYVPPSEYQIVQASDPVMIFPTVAPDRSFRGIVAGKDKYPMSRNERLGRQDPEGFLKEYQVDIHLIDQDSLFRPGMTCRLEIESVVATDCLMIPRMAVHEERDQAVWVGVKTFTGVERRTVTLGRSSSVLVEVLSGLREGEEVVLAN